MIKSISKWLLAIMVILLTFFLYEPDIPFDDLKTKYTNEASKFLEIEGMNVHYRVEGNGFPLILIHGTASSLHTWDEWTRHLSDDFTIIRMDLPAFGLTGPHPQADYSVTTYTNIIHQLLQKLNIDSCHVAGNSLGGNIARQYAKSYPDQVKKLILIDPSGAPRSSDPPLIFKLANTPLLSSLLKYITPRSIIKSNLKEVYYDDDKITDDLVTRYHDMARAPGNRQAFIDRARMTSEVRNDSSDKINCPTLIQWGLHDMWIPVSDTTYFVSEIPVNKVVIYENAGHVPMEEIPFLTAKDARTFLLSN